MAKRTGGFIGQDGINAPDPATGVSGTAGNEQVTVSFTSPSDVGGAAITEYRVTDSTGAFGATGSASPITVSGLTNGTSYTFNVWAINPFGWSSPSDASGGVTPSLLTRGIFAGGDNVDRTLIQYIDVSTTGNASDFGDLSGSGMDQGTGAGNATRSLFAGNYFGIEFVNPATLGNSADFGNLTDSTRAILAANATSTRCIFGGGSSRSNVIDYVTIATTGDAADFGDLTVGRDNLWGQVSSPTRAVFAGGESTSGNTNVIDYITPSSTGNATDFGDLIAAAREGNAGACSSTRGVFFGGNGPSDRIQYITIASTGNATDFGNLSSGQYRAAGATNAVRGVIGGGELAGLTNRIEYVTIASTGNALDFGDLLTADRFLAAASSNHGGLS